jgi:NNP family nitrate/nitrite transporter-like MFS transporter
MSNISTFFPKRLQGTALGLNAGLGNFGVTTMQIVIPLVMTVGVFGAFGGGSMVLLKDSGWIFGKIVAGTPTWIQNAGFAWVPSWCRWSRPCWFGMNNLKTLSPNYGGTLAAFAKITYLYTWPSCRDLGCTCTCRQAHRPGPAQHVGGAAADHRRHAAGDEAGRLRRDEGNIAKQFAIFSNKHTWSLTRCTS